MWEHSKDIGEFLANIVKTNASYLWFLVLAIWGGTASYLGRIRKNKLGFSFVELIGEWTISGFAGIITSYLCMVQGYSFLFTALLW